MSKLVMPVRVRLLCNNIQVFDYYDYMGKKERGWINVTCLAKRLLVKPNIISGHYNEKFQNI